MKRNEYIQQIDQLTKENERLTQQNKEYIEVIKKLVDEVKQRKQQNEQLQSITSTSLTQSQVKSLQTELHQLREENTKLSEDLKRTNESWMNDVNKHVEELSELQKKNSELQNVISLLMKRNEEQRNMQECIDDMRLLYKNYVDVVYALNPNVESKTGSKMKVPISELSISEIRKKDDITRNDDMFVHELSSVNDLNNVIKMEEENDGYDSPLFPYYKQQQINQFHQMNQQKNEDMIKKEKDMNVVNVSNLNNITNGNTKYNILNKTKSVKSTNSNEQSPSSDNLSENEKLLKYATKTINQIDKKIIPMENVMKNKNDEVKEDDQSDYYDEMYLKDQLFQKNKSMEMNDDNNEIDYEYDLINNNNIINSHCTDYNELNNSNNVNNFNQYNEIDYNNFDYNDEYEMNEEEDKTEESEFHRNEMNEEYIEPIQKNVKVIGIKSKQMKENEINEKKPLMRRSEIHRKLSKKRSKTFTKERVIIQNDLQKINSIDVERIKQTKSMTPSKQMKIINFTGISEMVKLQCIEEIKKKGGIFSEHFNEKVTHLISYKKITKSCLKALLSDVWIMPIDWILSENEHFENEELYASKCSSDILKGKKFYFSMSFKTKKLNQEIVDILKQLGQIEIVDSIDDCDIGLVDDKEEKDELWIEKLFTLHEFLRKLPFPSFLC